MKGCKQIQQITYFPQKEQLCTHHVGSGRKEDRGMLGRVNTARLAACYVASKSADLKSDFTATCQFKLCFLKNGILTRNLCYTDVSMIGIYFNFLCRTDKTYYSKHLYE